MLQIVGNINPTAFVFAVNGLLLNLAGPYGKSAVQGSVGFKTATV